MPWIVEEGHGCPSGRPFAVINKQSGKREGCHPSKEAATQQQKALYANAPKEDSMSGTGRDQPPTDTHAGDRHNAQDIGFLYHMAASLQGSIGVASHTTEAGSHPQVGALASTIISSHSEQLNQVGALQQSLGVGTGAAVTSKGAAATGKGAMTSGKGGAATVAAAAAGGGGTGGGGGRSRRDSDWDDDPGHLAQAVDASLDGAIEAFQGGETDQGVALVIAAAASVDALLAALNLPDADEMGQEPVGYASIGMRSASILPMRARDERETARSGEVIRAVPFELVPSADGLTLEGYAAVFNSPTKIQDRQGEFEEVILPGAFAASLRERTPVLMFEHGRHPLVGSMPLGVISEAEEDSRGLHITARLTDNWLIQPVRDAIRDGAIDGMSFRFSVPKGGDKWTERKGDLQLRAVNQADVRELGPVVFPAYEPTTVSVRSALDHFSGLTGRPGTRSAGGGESSDAQPGQGEASRVLSVQQTRRDRELRIRRIIRA